MDKIDKDIQEKFNEADSLRKPILPKAIVLFNEI